MTNTLLRAGALACALMTTTALTAPAMAQSAPEFRNLDANGVDLVQGDHVMALTEGSIGSGRATLALVRQRAGNAASQWDAITFLRTVSGTTATILIGQAGRFTDRFTGGTSATSFTPAKANGASLVRANGAYVYTAPDGTEVAFVDPTGGDDEGFTSNFCSDLHLTEAACSLLPASIASPDGRTVDMSFDLYSQPGGSSTDTLYDWRLADVSNSFGYSVAFSYADNSWSWSVPPSSGWFARTQADFRNSAAGSAVQASVDYDYPSAGITDVTDTGGRTWRLTQSGANLTGMRRRGASSDTTTIAYSGNIVTSVTNAGVTTSYARSVSGSTVTMTVTHDDGDSGTTDPQTVIVSDLGLGRPTSVTDPLSRSTTYGYDGDRRLNAVIAPEGNEIQYSHDARGNVTETRAVAKSGSGLSDVVASASFPSSCTNPVTCNRPTSTTDARGNTTDYTYDSSHGGVLSVTLPAPSSGADRPQTRYSYTQSNGEYLPTAVSACSAGTASSCVDTADETRTVIGHDASGNVTSLERRDGTGALSAATAMTYDAIGNVLTVDGPLTGSADTTTFRYNGARQVTGTISPDPDAEGSLLRRAARTTYANGLPTKFERGTVTDTDETAWAAFSSLEEVRQDYDSNNRPVVQRLVSGSTTYALTQTSYDGLGRPRCTAQRMNPSEFASLPSDACTLDTEGSHGPDRIARTTYDAAGQVTKVETGVGVTGVAADEVATTYTTNGQIETVTDANGNKTTYGYDGFDRRGVTYYPSPSTPGTSSTSDYEVFAYDAAGNVTARRLRDATHIGYSYDALDRLTETNYQGSELDVSYAYDLLGRMSSAAFPATGHALTFTYDALGRNLAQASPLGTASYQYDAAGRRTRLTYPGSTSLYVDYDYLVTGEVTRIRENGATSGAGVLGIYAYDDRGRRTRLTRGNETVTTYSYDAVSRLSALAQDLNGSSHDLTLDFAYNPASQIASNGRDNTAYSFTHANANVTSSVNGLNQLTATGGASVSHDARGNITAIGSASYGYDANNRMVSAPGSVSFAYDPLGRLLYSTGNPQLTRFAYDGQQLIAEIDYPGDILRRYVHGPGIDEPLVWYEGSGTSTRRWFHADERGSVVAVSDSSGNIVGSINRYDEYGVPQGGAITGRFGYTGQAFLPEIGLHYYRARMYWPGGRFMQTDPIGYGAGMNLYIYPTDPVNFTDPLGQCGSPDIIGWSTLYGLSDEGWIELRSVPIFGVDASCVNDDGSGDPTGSSGTGPIGLPQAAIKVVGKRPTRSPRQRLICTGIGYVLAGNPGTIGEIGGFLVPVRAGSAAIIPRQFTGELRAGPVMRGIGAGTFGWTQGGQFFSGFTDTIGHSALGTARQAQDIIMARHPGQFVIELVSGHAEDNSFITLSLPPSTSTCPSGTAPM